MMCYVILPDHPNDYIAVILDLREATGVGNSPIRGRDFGRFDAVAWLIPSLTALIGNFTGDQGFPRIRGTAANSASPSSRGAQMMCRGGPL